jgi:soluble lytic murein transglycosylase-like protein
MTVGTVDSYTEGAVISNAPAVYQPASGGNTAFSDTLRERTALTSGRADLDAIFEAAGRRYNLSPNLLKAVARVESNFRPHVVSRAGAMGVMQLMPGTAQGLGVTDPFDPEQNIMGGARYLRQLLDRFNGDLRVALSAYNGGQGRVGRNGNQVLPFTENYVANVLRHFNGGDITAGTVSFGRPVMSNMSSAQSPSAEASTPFDFSSAMAQMMFMKIIEMQMNSSNDDRRGFF